MTIQAAIEKIVARQIATELDRLAERNRPRPEAAEIAAAKERAAARWQSVVDTFADKAATALGAESGRFHPSNKDTRALFATVTGIKLPATVGGTMAAIAEYVGEEGAKAIADARQAYEERTAREREAREADIAAKHAKRIETIKTDILGGRPVSGEDLIDIARHLEIDVHPRTVGMVRNRVISISDGSARISGVGLSDSAWRLFRLVKAMLIEDEQPAEPEDEAVLALFGKR